MKTTEAFAHLGALVGACVLALGSAQAGESITHGDWSVSVEKGEVSEALFQKQPFIRRLGAFRVVGKEVRPFREIAEIRDREPRRLVYEGISDDTKHLYVEFGQVIEVGNTMSFMLSMAWLPPSPWPPDAVEGILEFAPSVVSLAKTDIPPDDPVVPGTCQFVAKLKDGGAVLMRVTGLDAAKTRIEAKDGHVRMRFQESRGYAPSPEGMKKRSLTYWTTSTDTHYVRFVFSRAEGKSANKRESE